jgi:hypothetical protein
MRRNPKAAVGVMLFLSVQSADADYTGTPFRAKLALDEVGDAREQMVSIVFRTRASTRISGQLE